MFYVYANINVNERWQIPIRIEQSQDHGQAEMSDRLHHSQVSSSLIIHQTFRESNQHVKHIAGIHIHELQNVINRNELELGEVFKREYEVITSSCCYYRAPLSNLYLWYETMNLE